MTQQTHAFVMDPIEKMDIQADTTFVLMLEAQRRGHEVLFVDPDDLMISHGRVVARAQPVTLEREVGNHFEFGEGRVVTFDDEVDVAWQRTDPPVDEAYITATQILAVCTRTLVLNRPGSILAYNEKLFATHFPDLMTDTVFTREYCTAA